MNGEIRRIKSFTEGQGVAGECLSSQGEAMPKTSKNNVGLLSGLQGGLKLMNSRRSYFRAVKREAVFSSQASHSKRIDSFARKVFSGASDFTEIICIENGCVK